MEVIRRSIDTITRRVDDEVRGRELGILLKTRHLSGGYKWTAMDLLELPKDYTSSYRVTVKLFSQEDVKQKNITCPGVVLVYGSLFANVNLATSKDFQRIDIERAEKLNKVLMKYYSDKPGEEERINREVENFKQAFL